MCWYNNCNEFGEGFGLNSNVMVLVMSVGLYIGILQIEEPGDSYLPAEMRIAWTTCEHHT